MCISNNIICYHLPTIFIFTTSHSISKKIYQYCLTLEELAYGMKKVDDFM